MHISKFFAVLAILLVVSSATFSQNSPAPIPYVDIVLTPNHSDWNYKCGDIASVDVMVMQYGVPLSNVNAEFEFGKEMLPSEKKGDTVFVNGLGKIEIGTMNQPGFKQLKVAVAVEGKTYKKQIKLAFSPDKIMPTVKMPDDFDSFWNKAKSESDKLPISAKRTFLPDKSTPTVDVFLVEIQNYPSSKHIYGYLCIPKDGNKHPVLFNPPGAGIKRIEPYTYYAQQGFISLSIEIHGISPTIDVSEYKNISTAFGKYWTIMLDDKNNYYYKDVFIGCSRSIDYLCSLPEFDGKNVVVTGGSQGGALSIVTAALNSRVTCIAAFYPAMCDHSGYLNERAGGWPHLFAKNNNTGTAKVETAAYYDVVNFAKRVNVPGFYSWGYNDNTCPPTSIFSAINSISAPKTIAITPISGHWRFDETDKKSISWIKEQL